MTFTDFKNLPISSKIVLVEFDVPAMPELDIWLNFSAGIWMTALTPGTTTIIGSDAQVGYYSNTNTTLYYDITGLIVDYTQVYTKVYSYDELIVANKSFYYDKTGAVVGNGIPSIMIHFDNWETPLGKLIQLKQVYGFCDKEDSVNGAYYNGTYYEPRIESIPTITKSKDPSFYGVIRFEGGTIQFNNSDGYYDQFKDLNLYRQVARIKLGFDTLAYTDYQTVFTGFVESYSWDFNKFSVKIADKRKTLTGKIPEKVFTKAEFPTIKDDNVNKPKPIGYGNIRKAALICTNEDAVAPAHYEYFLADTTYADIYSLSAVYVDNVAISSANYHVNLTTGILQVDTASVTDHITDVTVDFCPRAIYNSHEVVKTILFDYADVVFNNSYYYIAEWNQAQMNARNIEIYISESVDIIEIINKCMDASDSIFLIKDDGRFSSRLYDDDRAASETIENDEWMNDPSIDYNPEEFLSECTVTYNPEYSSGKKYRTVNTTYKSDVIARYAGEQSKEFDTIIETESDAIAKSESIMYFSKEIREIVKRKVMTQHLNLEVMDFVEALPKNRYGNDEINQLWEVLGITKNLTSGEIDLTLRFVKTYVPVPPTLYQTGVLWNHYLWGHKIYEVAYE